MVGGVAEQCGVASERHPLGPEGVPGYGQDQRLRAFEPLFDGQRDRLAGLDHPLIQPHPQPIALEPLGQLTDPRLVFACEDVVSESLGHRQHAFANGQRGTPGFRPTPAG